MSQPKMNIVAIPLKDIEHSFVLPFNATKIGISLRSAGGLMKMSWAAGEIAAGIYKTIPGERFIDLVRLKNRTIYFTSSVDADTAEIETFV